MQIQIGFDIRFELAQRTPFIVALRVHPSRESDLLAPERFLVEPDMPVDHYVDGFGNRCGRLVAPRGRLRLRNDAVVHDGGDPDPVHLKARQFPIEELPSQAMQFLLPSRYCETDLLGDVASELFAQTEPGWPRVQAICDWVHANVRFDYRHTRVTKTAHDVYCERTGVCRDFVHLAVTFCRCLNIPARYATGYLGDIGVPPAPYPMDFSAWFEVLLEGGWHVFDSRHNRPRIGRVLMARGRDAADVALTTSFGQADLKHFEVWTDEVGGR